MAVRAALEMRRRLRAWNDARAGRARRRFATASGSTRARCWREHRQAERHSYALVGDPVNSRRESRASPRNSGSDILVSGATRRHLDGRFDLVQLPAVR